MCKVGKRFRPKSGKVTGYKTVVKVEGKYYSPCTGVEYIAGQKVTPIRGLDKRNMTFASIYWEYGKCVQPGHRNYEPKMKNKTGVFLEKEDIEYLDRHSDEITIEMTISGGLYHASTGSSPTVVGNFIESIKEV